MGRQPSSVCFTTQSVHLYPNQPTLKHLRVAARVKRQAKRLAFIAATLGIAQDDEQGIISIAKLHLPIAKEPLGNLIGKHGADKQVVKRLYHQLGSISSTDQVRAWNQPERMVQNPAHGPDRILLADHLVSFGKATERVARSLSLGIRIQARTSNRIRLVQ
jgi:hypothetical protein